MDFDPLDVTDDFDPVDLTEDFDPLDLTEALDPVDRAEALDFTEASSSHILKDLGRGIDLAASVEEGACSGVV